MQDTSSLEYSLTATVCLESQQVLKLRQLVSTDDFSIPACATVFGAADSAVSRGKAFDANIAADGLRGLVDAPRKFLAECIDVTPTVAHAEEYACILSHHGGAHGAAQADQGGYCDQRRGIRRFCPPQRCAADAGRAFDGRTHSGADVANESACGHCVGDRDDHFDSER